MRLLFRFYTFIILLIEAFSKTENVLGGFVLLSLLYSPESFPEECLGPGGLTAPGMAEGEAAGRVCLTVTSGEICVCDIVSPPAGWLCSS